MSKVQQSYEIYDMNLNFIRWLADFAGCDMMVENYRMNYRTCFAIFNLVLFSIGVAYSFVFYFSSNWAKCIETGVVFALLIQGIIKFYNGYIHRHFFKLMYGRIRDLHFKHRNHPTNVPLLLLMERIYLATRAISVLYGAASCSYLLYPIYMYWTTGEGILMLPIRFPFIDADSLVGYIITTTIHLLASLLMALSMGAADTAILLFVCSLDGFVEVFKYDLNELSTLLQAKHRNEQVIQEKVREICIQHMAVIEYESDLDERYISTCFFQVVSATIGLSLALFLVYVYHYIPGCGMVLAMGFQLLEFSLLGTVLTIKNEEMTDVIYEAHWYLMNRPEQKCFALMLHKSQNFVEMTVGGLAPLNIETFVSIVKSIYSYFMMLISFLE